MRIGYDGRSCFVGVTIIICFGLVYLFSSMDSIGVIQDFLMIKHRLLYTVLVHDITAMLKTNIVETNIR